MENSLFLGVQIFKHITVSYDTENFLFSYSEKVLGTCSKYFLLQIMQFCNIIYQQCSFYLNFMRTLFIFVPLLFPKTVIMTFCIEYFLSWHGNKTPV